MVIALTSVLPYNKPTTFARIPPIFCNPLADLNSVWSYTVNLECFFNNSLIKLAYFSFGKAFFFDSSSA